MRGHRLTDGTLRIGGREIDLTRTGAHVLNTMAEKDRARPPGLPLISRGYPHELGADARSV